jgi:hypothetical protein
LVCLFKLIVVAEIVTSVYRCISIETVGLSEGRYWICKGGASAGHFWDECIPQKSINNGNHSISSELFVHSFFLLFSIICTILLGSQHVGRVYLSLLRTWYIICNDNWRSMTPGGPMCQSDR